MSTYSGKLAILLPDRRPANGLIKHRVILLLRATANPLYSRPSPSVFPRSFDRLSSANLLGYGVVQYMRLRSWRMTEIRIASKMHYWHLNILSMMLTKWWQRLQAQLWRGGILRMSQT